METETKKILLTGVPGCGKTTAILNIIDRLSPISAAGFVTREIRQNNTRKGFRWIRLDGPGGILAHVDIQSPFKVGKYRVDLHGFEKEVVPVLDIRKNSAHLFVIDEIGKMECLSEKFIRAVRALFDSDRSILATVSLKGSGLIFEVKKNPKNRVFHLNQKNHNQITAEIVSLFSDIFKQ